MTPPWLLPEHVEDILPPYAEAAESLRRRLVDLFAGYGYELVCPPLVEYLESLLTGAAADLDLNTFKVVDGLSGRQMGIRADITPQAARIDAHLLNRQGVARLCYAGPVLHTLPAGLLSSREPFQIGAELFGHAGIEADIEILELMRRAFSLAALPGARVSVAHVGLFRALVEAAGLPTGTAEALFTILRNKDVPALAELTGTLEARWRDAFRLLPELYGDAGVLDEARRHLPAIDGVRRALDDLAALAAAEEGRLAFDLADLRGYGYHTGAVFAAYAGGQARAIAMGGRYDGAGRLFGRARPATGFSLDLRAILDCLPAPARRSGILVPHAEISGLHARIAELRAAGERVVVELPGQEAYRAESGCDRLLRLECGDWKIYPL